MHASLMETCMHALITAPCRGRLGGGCGTSDNKAWEWRREITFHGPHARLRPGPFFSSLGDPDPHLSDTHALALAFTLRKTLDPRTSSCALAPPHKSSNRRSSHNTYTELG